MGVTTTHVNTDTSWYTSNIIQKVYMTISKDRRQRVVTAYMDGKGTMDEIADIFVVSTI